MRVFLGRFYYFGHLIGIELIRFVDDESEMRTMLERQFSVLKCFRVKYLVNDN
ncbi:hypothetical protein D3C86_1989650 [compost metagenome]